MGAALVDSGWYVLCSADRVVAFAVDILECGVGFCVRLVCVPG